MDTYNLGKFTYPCFICGRTLKHDNTSLKFIAVTSDGQTVLLGEDCFKKVYRAGKAGFVSNHPHSKGGPVIYELHSRPKEEP